MAAMRRCKGCAEMRFTVTSRLASRDGDRMIEVGYCYRCDRIRCHQCGVSQPGAARVCPNCGAWVGINPNRELGDLDEAA